MPARTEPPKSKYGIGECKLCGIKFTKKKKWQEFCHSKHRDKWHNIKRVLQKMGAME